MPAAEALLSRFRAAHTQVLGVSIDSVYSHANWAADLGGISFPLLADFHPKGALAQECGLYLEGAGITDRATVFIDSGGTVQHASSSTPGGERNLEELAAMCEDLDGRSKTQTEPAAAAPGLPAGAALYVKNACGFSRAALLARSNLHLDSLRVVNVSEDESALQALRKATGAETAPCLIIEGTPLSESAAIVEELTRRAAPIA